MEYDSARSVYSLDNGEAPLLGLADGRDSIPFDESYTLNAIVCRRIIETLREQQCASKWLTGIGSFGGICVAKSVDANLDKLYGIQEVIERAFPSPGLGAERHLRGLNI